MDKLIIFNDYECKILKVWQGGFYDLQTCQKTKLGIIEQYLSVPQELLSVGEPVSTSENGLHKHVVSNAKRTVCPHTLSNFTKGMWICAECGEPTPIA